MISLTLATMARTIYALVMGARANAIETKTKGSAITPDSYTTRDTRRITDTMAPVVVTAVSATLVADIGPITATAIFLLLRAGFAVWRRSLALGEYLAAIPIRGDSAPY